MGEARVRLSFNPATSERGGNVSDMVGVIKTQTAQLIDFVECIPQGDTVSSEQMRLMRLAQTAYEEAAMWAVKAATAV